MPVELQHRPDYLQPDEDDEDEKSDTSAIHRRLRLWSRNVPGQKADAARKERPAPTASEHIGSTGDIGNEQDAAVTIEQKRRRLGKTAWVHTLRLLGLAHEELSESADLLASARQEENQPPDVEDEAWQLSKARENLSEATTVLEDERQAYESDLQAEQQENGTDEPAETANQSDGGQPPIEPATARAENGPPPADEDWRQTSEAWQMPAPPQADFGPNRYQEAHAHAVPAQQEDLDDLRDDIDHAHNKADTALKATAVVGGLNAIYTHHEKVVARRNENRLSKATEGLQERIHRQEERLEQQRQVLDRLERRPVENLRPPVTAERLAAKRSDLGEVARAASIQRDILRETREIAKETPSQQQEVQQQVRAEVARGPSSIERPPVPEEKSTQPLWSERRFAEHIEKGPGMVAAEETQQTAADTTPGSQTAGGYGSAQRVEPAEPAAASNQPADTPQKSSGPASNIPGSPPSHLLAYVIILAVIVLGLIMLLVRLAK